MLFNKTKPFDNFLYLNTDSIKLFMYPIFIKKLNKISTIAKITQAKFRKKEKKRIWSLIACRYISEILLKDY